MSQNPIASKHVVQLPLSREESTDALWNAPVGVFISNPAGRFTYVNPAMARIYGYSTPDEMIESVTDIASQIYFHPADRDYFVSQLEFRGEIADHECRQLRCDGSTFWISRNARAIRGDDGRILFFQGFSTDISERKRSHERALDRERYFRKIIETSQEGFWVIDCTGCIAEVNSAYCAMSGYTRAELLGMRIGDLDALESVEETSARIARIVANGSEFFETSHRRKDGSCFAVEISVTWLEQDGGQLVCFARDIEERRASGEALREQHQRLANVIEATRIATWEWHVKTGATVFDERWAEMIGYTLAELAPVSIATWQQFTHPGDLAESYALLTRHFAGETPYYHFEGRMRHKHGHWIWVLDRGRVVSYDEEGKPLLMFGTHTDITYRKQAEFELAAQHRLLDNLARMVPGVIYQYRLYPDGHSAFPYSSPGMELIYEMDPATVREDATPVFGRLHPDDRDRVSRAIVASAESLSTFLCEFRVVLPSQGLRWRWSHAQPERLEDGSTLWHGIILDINRRKETEIELEESEQKYRRLIEKSPDIVYIFSDRRGALFVSPRAEAVLGYTVEHILANPTLWSDSIHPEDQPQVARAILQAQGGDFQVEYRIRDAQGKWHWFLDRSIDRRLGDDETIIEGLVTDITERKQNDSALRESETLFRGMFEYTSVGKTLTAIDGTLLRVNQAMADMLGYTIDELQQLNFNDLTHPDDREASRNAASFLLSGGHATYRFQKRYIHRNTSSVWADVNVTLLHDEQGEPLYFIAGIIDITQQKLAEEEKERMRAQLTQAQKMESVGRLAGGVAHDFNNMLGVILGYTELLLLEAGEGSQLQSSLEAIHGAAQRSARLTRQLLGFARKQTVAPKVLDLNETLENMLEMVRRLIGEHISLVYRPGNSLRPVKIDPSQVDQIVTNLCVNARDAIGENGTILIETAAVSIDQAYAEQVSEALPGDYVQLAVSDDGCGIDTELLSHLFEPFYTTKEMGKGTGLGLSMVFGIVRQNGGFLNVSSEPGVGTTFRIFLPAISTGRR